VSKYDAAGNLQWTQQYGTAASETSDGVSDDGLGNVYIAGTTYDGVEYGAFVAKISDSAVPEPATTVLAAFAAVGGFGLFRHQVSPRRSLLRRGYVELSKINARPHSGPK
jgi:hypothetical protein